eukprot:1261939-Pleurochrysis_carterae.AAC.2
MLRSRTSSKASCIACGQPTCSCSEKQRLRAAYLTTHGADAPNRPVVTFQVDKTGRFIPNEPAVWDSKLGWVRVDQTRTKGCCIQCLAAFSGGATNPPCAACGGTRCDCSRNQQLLASYVRSIQLKAAMEVVLRLSSIH